MITQIAASYITEQDIPTEIVRTEVSTGHQTLMAGDEALNEIAAAGVNVSWRRIVRTWMEGDATLYLPYEYRMASIGDIEE